MKRRLLQITSCFLITIIVCSYALSSNYYSESVNAASHQHDLDCYTDGDIEKALLCDQIVVNLTPAQEIQKLKIGEDLNKKATAYYLDGHSEEVECIITGYNDHLYSTEQIVDFSYGTYSTNYSNHIPFTTTVKINIDAYHQLSVSSNNITNGIVSGDSGRLLENASCSVTAHTSPGVIFSGWFIGGGNVSNAETYTFNMPANDLDIVAQFKKVEKIKVELNQLFHDTYDQEPYYNGISYMIEQGIVITKDMLTVSRVFDDETSEVVDSLDYELENNLVNRYGTNRIDVSTNINNVLVTGSAIVVGDSIEFSKFIEELLATYGLEDADYDSLIIILNDSVKQLHQFQQVIVDIADEIKLTGLSDDLNTRLTQVYTEVANIYDRVNTLEVMLQETLGDQIDIADANAISKKILEIRKEIDDANELIAKLQVQIILLDLTIEEKTKLLLSIMDELSYQTFLSEELNAQKLKLIEEVTVQQKLVSEVDLEILNLKQSISAQETTINQLELQQGTSETIVAGVTAESSTTLQEIERLKTENKLLNEQIIEIEKQTTELDTEITILQNKKTQISGTLTTKEDELVSIMVENNTLQTIVNIDTLEKLLINLDHANSYLAETNTYLLQREELQ